jgi:putative FmdB family regulatory protein
MPTYDYECRDCGHEFELFQAMSEDPIRVCPECGGEVRRLIGGGMGVIFRGSGFYVTDNRGAGGNGSKRKEEASADSSGTSGDSEGGTSSSAGSSGGTGSAGGNGGSSGERGNTKSASPEKARSAGTDG